MSHIMQANQPFVVNRHHNLTVQDLEVLTQAYLPIIGAQAQALYVTLFQFQTGLNHLSDSFIHAQLLAQLNMGLDQFDQARIRLEGIGLIQTYRDKSSQGSYQKQTILYVLHEPLSWYDFFNHPLYSALLYKQIGQIAYDNLVQAQVEYRVNDELFTEITTAFDQVYHLNLSQTWHHQENSSQLAAKEAETNTILSSANFDYAKYLKYMMAEGIDHSELTGDLKAQVLGLHQLYALNEIDLVRVTNLATNHLNGRVQLDRMKEIVERRPEFRNKGAQGSTVQSQKSLQKIKQKLHQEYPKLNDKDINIMALCQVMSVQDFLIKSKEAKKGFATDQEHFFVKDLQEKTNLPTDSLNFLIYYLLIISKRPNLYKSDLQRVANEWQQKGLKDISDILAYIGQTKKDQSKLPYQVYQGNKTGSYREVRPSWMDQGQDAGNNEGQPLKDHTGQEVDEETIQARLDRLYKEDHQE
ncbi:DnaD domain protein [Eremococcus coleocola]|uniref:Replication initiation and membrane attachment protein, DnaB/DnaD family n=1 Tax=Eremococcus coleocola ACS-139-V-Col8 TaxID=908337 RepID=E4KPI6_9LACT|nr:DnaD domain protein [Eremococcus coleocola]EFR30987.1 replication initiation and membrane attachment protein, DnaB/DnaD family [Eremococcus coleocola ACS-139-V-Col8]